MNSLSGKYWIASWVFPCFPVRWKGNGRIRDEIYYDSLRVYSIALESITQGSLIGELAEIAKAHYQQEAVFIRYLGQAEIL